MFQDFYFINNQRVLSENNNAVKDITFISSHLKQFKPSYNLILNPLQCVMCILCGVRGYVEKIKSICET
jgi:hypothetical protein